MGRVAVAAAVVVAAAIGPSAATSPGSPSPSTLPKARPAKNWLPTPARMKATRHPSLPPLTRPRTAARGRAVGVVAVAAVAAAIGVRARNS